MKLIIFPFTPTTTGNIFSKKKLSIRYFLILFQFLSLQSLSTSLHSKATEVSSIRSNCAIRANQSFVTHCSFSAEGLPRRSKVSCGKAMASCFFTNVWNPDISHGHGHLMISNPCLQNSFTGSCRALQSNLLFMMSPHKVPVKRCFSLCNTENFFPVFRTVLFGLCTALPFSIFIFLFSPREPQPVLPEARRYVRRRPERSAAR